jgi:phytanoyl-CoA hydroxylase
MKPVILTAEQIHHYHEHGYVLLGKVLTDAQVAAMQAEELRFRTASIWPDINVKTGHTLFRSQIQAYSAAVREVGITGAHVPAMQQLIGPDLIFWFTQFVTKFPDAASGKSEFPWHQDNGYSKGIEPATNITVWVALDVVNEHNGCVYVHPGSHKRGLLPHETKGESWHLHVPIEGDGVPAILQPGEAVAFTGLTLHRSLLNHSDQPRRGFFMEYANANAVEHATTATPRPLVERSCVYFIDGQADLVRRTTPPPLA